MTGIQRSAASLLLLLVLFAPEARGQILHGRVLEEGSERTVATALIRLVEPAGAVRATALTDSVGRYVLAPPEAGEYYLEVRRIGYEEARSPLLALKEDGEHDLDLLVRPLPVGLAGFEVTVDAGAMSETVERDLRHYGIEPSALGSRYITRADIADLPFTRDFSGILDWRPIAGLKKSTSHRGVCFSFTRGGNLGGRVSCAVVVLNGAEITSEVLLTLPPDWVDRVVVLTPEEAVTLFGVRGEAGAVMIWTGLARN